MGGFFFVVIDKRFNHNNQELKQEPAIHRSTNNPKEGV